MGTRREGPSSLCILAVGWSFKWEEDSSLSGWHGKKKRVHDAQASARRTASQDQAFACDHTCVIPINIGRHRCSRVTGCTQGYFAPSFTRAHRTDLLTDWLTSPPILSLPLSLSSLILSSLFPSDLAGQSKADVVSWRCRHSRARNSLRFREKEANQSGRRFVWPEASYCEKRNEPAVVIGSEMGSGDETRGIPHDHVLSRLFWPPGFPRLDRIVSINLVTELGDYPWVSLRGFL